MDDMFEISFHLNWAHGTSGEYELAPVTGEHTLIDECVGIKWIDNRAQEREEENERVREIKES